MKITLFFNFIAKTPNPDGNKPKIKGSMNEANKLIKLLTINLTPVFLNIAQKEVIIYQLSNNTKEAAI